MNKLLVCPSALKGLTLIFLMIQNDTATYRVKKCKIMRKLNSWISEADDCIHKRGSHELKSLVDKKLDTALRCGLNDRKKRKN